MTHAFPTRLSSDLIQGRAPRSPGAPGSSSHRERPFGSRALVAASPETPCCLLGAGLRHLVQRAPDSWRPAIESRPGPPGVASASPSAARSEEHTSELQSLMRISYAVFCLKK